MMLKRSVAAATITDVIAKNPMTITEDQEVPTTISSIIYGPNDTKYAIADLYSRENIHSILLRLAKLEIERQVEFVELSCKNCGGKIQQKYNDPIFKCPYCKTVYAIGYKQVNAS